MGDSDRVEETSDSGVSREWGFGGAKEGGEVGVARACGAAVRGVGPQALRTCREAAFTAQLGSPRRGRGGLSAQIAHYCAYQRRCAHRTFCHTLPDEEENHPRIKSRVKLSAPNFTLLALTIAMRSPLSPKH